MSNKPIRYGMKRKSIQKRLNKKVNAWLDSLPDKGLRKMAAENTIVTGGAIASMLLGEKVNDYDIYFRDLETAKRVAEHYAQESGADVIVEDVENILGETETRVVNYIKSEGCYEPPDVEDGGKYKILFVSANAISLANGVQLINRFYGEPDQIHRNYDFEHAKCYWDHGNQRLELPASALECLMSRNLIYTGSLYPICSIFRAKKFIERGWRINAGQLLKIMWQTSEVDLSKTEILIDQLTGVDLVYMKALIDALQGVDPEKISSAYVAQIIDRIFE